MKPANSDSISESCPPPPNFLEKTAAAVIHWRLAILAVAAIVTILAWPIAARLNFDQSIESLYADDDQHFAAYARSKKHFGGDEFAIVAWEETGILSEDSTSVSPGSRGRIEALAEKLSLIPGVEPGSVQHAVDALAFPYNGTRSPD